MRSYMNYYNTDAHCEEALANLMDDTFIKEQGWKRVFQEGIGEGILSENENIVAIFDTDCLPQFHAFAIYDYNPKKWKVLSNQPETPKQYVYALISEWSIDFEQDARVALYETEELARHDMEIEYKNFLNEFNNFDECSIGDTCASASIEGEWSENHCAWHIAKLVINTKSYYTE